MPGKLSAKEEKLWNRAKREAKQSNPDDFYALANHIFQRMKEAHAKKAVHVQGPAVHVKGIDPMSRDGDYFREETRLRPRFGRAISACTTRTSWR